MTMESTLTAPLPTFVDRFRAAWRGEESLAWAFWSVFVLCGFALWFLQLAAKLVLIPIVGNDFSGPPETLPGQVHLVVSEAAELVHVAVSFIVIARCSANVASKNWTYCALGFLFALPIGVVDDFQKIVGVFSGVGP